MMGSKIWMSEQGLQGQRGLKGLQGTKRNLILGFLVDLLDVLDLVDLSSGLSLSPHPRQSRCCSRRHDRKRGRTGVPDGSMGCRRFARLVRKDVRSRNLLREGCERSRKLLEGLGEDLQHGWRRAERLTPESHHVGGNDRIDVFCRLCPAVRIAT